MTESIRASPANLPLVSTCTGIGEPGRWAEEENEVLQDEHLWQQKLGLGYVYIVSCAFFLMKCTLISLYIYIYIYIHRIYIYILYIYIYNAFVLLTLGMYQVVAFQHVSSYFLGPIMVILFFVPVERRSASGSLGIWSSMVTMVKIPHCSLMFLFKAPYFFWISPSFPMAAAMSQPNPRHKECDAKENRWHEGVVQTIYQTQPATVKASTGQPCRCQLEMWTSDDIWWIWCALKIILDT